ncbi:MAG: class B sortase [Eubacteriales bacterium]|nr:class B sortase [Eubacteriales bacterium]
MDRGKNYRQTPAAGKRKAAQSRQRNRPIRRLSRAGYRPPVGSTRSSASTGHGKFTGGKRGILRPVILAVLIIVMIVSLTEIVIYFVHSRNNRAEQAALANEHQAALALEQPAPTAATGGNTATVPSADGTAPTNVPTTQAATVSPVAEAVGGEFFQTVGLTRQAFKPIVKQNSDAVGWITIEGIVDLPVVYRDNTYYLTHDFTGKRNTCGAIFLDVNHPLHSDSQNLLIYGHNMKDGSMFGRLIKYYSNVNFLRTNYTLQFETRFDTYTYLIFAVVRVKMDVYSKNFLNFAGHTAFTSADAFNRYIDEVYQQSLYTRFLDVAPTDTLITLVTCLDDDRLVLLARRQRADETESDINHALLGLYEK